MIEIERGDFSAVEANLEAVEPQSIILRMGVPRPGFSLPIPEHDAFTRGRPDAIGLRDLLSHPNSGSLVEDGRFDCHAF